MERTKEKILNAIREASMEDYKGGDIPLDLRVDESTMKRITNRIRKYLREHPERGRFYSDYNGVINVISVFVSDYQQAKKFVNYVSTLNGTIDIEPSPLMHPMYS